MKEEMKNIQGHLKKIKEEEAAGGALAEQLKRCVEGMRTITSFQKTDSRKVDNNVNRANILNQFFNRFNEVPTHSLQNCSVGQMSMATQLFYSLN